MNFNDLLKNKKTVNAIAVLLMGIIIVIAGGHFTQKDTEVKETISRPEAEIERRLENILSSVKGAGKVSVFVVLQNYGSSDFVKDVKYSDSGNEEKTVIADSEPVLTKTLTPDIKGVIVTAQGAKDREVRDKLKNAVITALGVMPHRVEVLEKK